MRLDGSADGGADVAGYRSSIALDFGTFCRTLRSASSGKINDIRFSLSLGEGPMGALPGPVLSQ